MLEKILDAYESTLQMLEDGIKKIPDNAWRTGTTDYLIPVRIAYHTIIGLEWFATELPWDEHKRTRRYGLNWMGPVDDMPSRQEMLQDIAWIRDRIAQWFEKRSAAGVESEQGQENVFKALYFLRHSQHHIGEFAASARLANAERPGWK
jgi:hypothetical protein